VNANARTCASLQSWSVSLHVANANDRLDAAITATKMCASRISSVSRSTAHRHRVAGVIDEQLVAADVVLPHRHRQPDFPAAIQFAEPAVAIAIGMKLDILDDMLNGLPKRGESKPAAATTGDNEWPSLGTATPLAYDTAPDIPIIQPAWSMDTVLEDVMIC